MTYPNEDDELPPNTPAAYREEPRMESKPRKRPLSPVVTYNDTTVDIRKLHEDNDSLRETVAALQTELAKYHADTDGYSGAIKNLGELREAVCDHLNLSSNHTRRRLYELVGYVLPDYLVLVEPGSYKEAKGVLKLKDVRSTGSGQAKRD